MESNLPYSLPHLYTKRKERFLNHLQNLDIKYILDFIIIKTYLILYYPMYEYNIKP